MLFYVDFEQISDSYCRTKVCEMYIFLVKLFSWFLFLLLEGQFCLIFRVFSGKSLFLP